jgi:hypothetical protein
VCLHQTENDQEIVVLVSVDDLMIFSETKHLIYELIEHLIFIYKEVKSREGDKHSYLGMQFSFNSDHLKISMEGYIDNILLENNRSSPHRIHNPLVSSASQIRIF